MACLSTYGQQHGLTCPRSHGNAVFCSFELSFIETQKSNWNEKRRHCLGTLDSVRASPWQELKIDCLFLRKPFHSQTCVLFQQSIFPLPLDAALRQQAIFLVS